MPSDYSQRVSKRGDEYRDTFTKVLLYLSSLAEVREMDCVVASVLDGNKSSLEVFEESCRATNPEPPAASHFALATTSAGATSVNIQRQAKGGCFTISSSYRVVEYGLRLSQLYFRTYDAGDVHLFLEGRDVNRPDDLTVLYVKLGRSHFNPLVFTFERPDAVPSGARPARHRRYAELFTDLQHASPSSSIYSIVQDEGFDSSALIARRGNA